MNRASIHLLFEEILVQPLRVLVQAESRSHMEHVKFEPNSHHTILQNPTQFYIVGTSAPVNLYQLC